MKEKLPIISVIIHNYNYSQYLQKCVDSVLGQTYPNIEIVIVNDASSDKSDNLIKNMLAKHSNIKYVHLDKHVGTLKARLMGLKESTGDYFAFIDGKDSVSMDYYRKMYRALEKSDADVCFADFAYEYNDGQRKQIPSLELKNSDISYSGTELLDKFMKGHGYDFTWQVLWNKLFSARLKDGLIKSIEELSLTAQNLDNLEDVAYTIAIYSKCRRAVNVHNVYYYFFKDYEVKSTKGKYTSDLGDVKKVLGFMKSILEENKVYSKYKTDYELWERLYYSMYRNIAKSKGYIDVYDVVAGYSDTTDKINVLNPSVMLHLEKQFYYHEDAFKNIMLDKTKVVSFDIFDTLIKRNVLNPSDVFVLMSNKLQGRLSETFSTMLYDIRYAAETGAREKVDSREVTFDEIYAYIEDEYHIDHDFIELMKKTELEIEKQVIVQRNSGYDYYDVAAINGKKIVYTTDMYLTKDFIYELLVGAGYSKNNEMFLSNEYRQTKGSGKLYRQVFKKCKIEPKEMVHIGDNYISDYEMAKDAGIRAYHIPNVRDLFMRFLYEDLKGYNNTYQDLQHISFIDVRVMFATIANKLFDFPYVFNYSTYQNSTKYLGYYALGLYLYSFTDWVRRKSKGKKNIHFVARDGYLPMLAYDIMRDVYGDDNMPKSNYLYMSRKSLYPLSIYSKNDLYNTTAQMNTPRQSIEKLLKYFPKHCIKWNEVEKIDSDTYKAKFKTMDNFYKLVDVIDKCIDYKALDKYRNQFKSYYNNIISDNDILVDIGYSGRCEVILHKVLGKSIDNLYVHPITDLVYRNEDLGKFNTNFFYEYKPKVSGELRELVFMKNDYSFLGCSFDSGKPELIFDTKNAFTDAELAIMTPIKDNAVAFVRDYINNIKGLSVLHKYPREFITQPWENYLHTYIEDDKNIFNDFIFEDDLGLGYIKMIDNWNTLNYKNLYMQNAGKKPKKKLIRRIGEFILPVDTRRRRFVFNMANKLLPKGSKRREFVKKFIR